MVLFGKIKSIVAKKAVHETVFVASGSLVNGASLFVITLILARVLDQAVFGVFSLSILVLTTMGEISDFGLNTGFLRFAPYFISTEQTNSLKQLVKTVWGWRVGISATLTVGGIIFAYPIARYLFGQPSIFPYFAFASLGIGGVIMLGFLSTFLQSHKLFRFNATLQSLKGILRLAAVIILALLKVTNLYVYLAVYISIPWLLFLLNLRVLPENFRGVEVGSEIKSKLNRQLANFSFWITIASLTSIAAGKIDQVMVSHYLGLEEVAVYTVAWQFIQVFIVFANSISSVLIPRFSGLQSKEDLRAFFGRTILWLLAVTIGLAAIIYPSQFLISIFFGTRYASAIPVYLILAFGTLANIIVIPFSLAITTYNKTYIATLAGMFQLVLNVFLNLLFIPKFGVIGVAYTYLITNVVQLFWDVCWSFYLLKKKEFIVL
jgi:O-antigen/teichoic acid export membrane protein